MLMESELTFHLQSVVSRLDCKEALNSQPRDIDDFYTSRLLSTSPADAECGDSPGDRTEDMAIDDATDLNWDEENTISSRALPPPSSYNDLNESTCAETPSLNSDLEQIFNSDPNSDVLETTTPGVCGLSNLGNTCFMNSGLQCLLNTPPLVQAFVTLSKENANNDTLATHIANLFQKVWSGKYSKVKPTEFQQALANQYLDFKEYRQQDCQEFLALLLDGLHESLNTASCKSHVSDLSADPMTPHSVSEESAVAAVDAVELDCTSQMALSIGGRCEVSSSSSRSSESSLGNSQIRNRPLPDEVLPFKPFPTPSLNVDARMLMGGESMEDGVVVTQIALNGITEFFFKKELKPGCTQLNNSQPCFLDNICKNAKISNINVVVPEPIVNNEILFDSDKFPRHEKLRLRDPCENLNLIESHDFGGKTLSAKRFKETNKLQNNSDTSDLYNCNKRFKLGESYEKEKNIRMEFERSLRDDEKSLDDDDGEFSGAVAAADILDDDLAAENQWDKHFQLNQSIILESFQGQFKSTVVCSECRFVSSTYEPFMYLSVPLPHAMEQQLCITFVPALTSPIKYLLTMNKQQKVLHIKQQLRTLMGVDEDMPLEIAEVLQHHIACILDENRLIKSIAGNDPHRSIYAFEISDQVTYTGEAEANSDSFSSEPLDLTPEQVNLFEKSTQFNNLDTQARKQENKNPVIAGCAPNPYIQTHEITDEIRCCTVCLEEISKNLKNHPGCSCYLCDECIERTQNYYIEENKDIEITSGFLPCPVCRVVISVDEWVDTEEKGDASSIIKMLLVPILFRQEYGSDDEQHNSALFSHPHIIRVANRLPGATLHKLIRKIVPYPSNYSILLVDAQGYRCSKCPFSANCKGCLVPSDGEVILSSEYNLAVHFSTPVVENNPIDHISLRNLRENESLSLYDCLSAFCESETLDEHNPWFCPKCERNQCATKTLSVWKYPDFLIVYLKRFIFHELTSVKLDNRVSFPLTDLSVSMPPVNTDYSRRYDLYACVNHLGGTSGGHYTAYAKNPRTGDWHFFNDDTVTTQKPQETDYDQAYILFYQRQDTQPTSTMLTPFLGSGNMKAHIDQLLESKSCNIQRNC